VLLREKAMQSHAPYSHRFGGAKNLSAMNSLGLPKSTGQSIRRRRRKAVLVFTPSAITATYFEKVRDREGVTNSALATLTWLLI
jgi:hypothetical protein